jgi:hypothetical protein
MDEWLKEYTAKLAEANGISMDGPAENGHAENGGGASNASFWYKPMGFE